MLEAARWAPSAYNIQPWRFIYFTRGSAGWLDAIGLLDSFNAGWAKNASAIVFVVSERLIAGEDLQTPQPSQTHSFDTGAAWAQLALQATALGYQAHAMAGLHFDEVRRKLAIPDSFHVEIAVAIGREAKPSILPPSLQQREIPSPRLPLNEIVFAECFSAQAVDMAPRPSGTERESRT
jgi:nitroreductase